MSTFVLIIWMAGGYLNNGGGPVAVSGYDTLDECRSAGDEIKARAGLGTSYWCIRGPGKRP